MTARTKLLNAVVPPLIGGLLGLALGYVWFSPSQAGTNHDEEIAFSNSAKWKLYAEDRAALQEECQPTAVRALPSGLVTSCSPDGKWLEPDYGVSVEVESYTVAPMKCPPERPDCIYGIDLPRLVAAIERGELVIPAELRALAGQPLASLTEAEQLQAVYGAKLVKKVVKEMEVAQGITYSEDQIDAVLNSPAFGEMLKREIRSQDKYGFCDDPESPTCTFGTQESDYK